MRVRMTLTLCALPPGTSVIELGYTLLMPMLGMLGMLGAEVTVRLKVAVTDETPLPLAVIVIVRLLTRVALLAALRLMLPEFPVPGWVKVAVTPLGRVLLESVMLPV